MCKKRKPHQQKKRAKLESRQGQQNHNKGEASRRAARCLQDKGSRRGPQAFAQAPTKEGLRARTDAACAARGRHARTPPCRRHLRGDNKGRALPGPGEDSEARRGWSPSRISSASCLRVQANSVDFTGHEPDFTSGDPKLTPRIEERDGVPCTCLSEHGCLLAGRGKGSALCAGCGWRAAGDVAARHCCLRAAAEPCSAAGKQH